MFAYNLIYSKSFPPPEIKADYIIKFQEKNMCAFRQKYVCLYISFPYYSELLLKDV